MDLASAAPIVCLPDHVSDVELDGILSRGALSPPEVEELVYYLRGIQDRQRTAAAVTERKLSCAVVLLRRLLEAQTLGCLGVDASASDAGPDEPDTAKNLADRLIYGVQQALDHERQRYILVQMRTAARSCPLPPGAQ